MTDTTKPGPWIGWNGGECPEHPETVVQVVTQSAQHTGVLEAAAWVWSHHGTEADIIAYRVIKEHKEPREFWVFTNGHGDLCASTKWHLDAIHVREVEQ